MIAFTPQSLKRARFEFARRRFFQKSGKTNAPTIGQDDKGSPPRSLKPQSSPPLLAIRDDYHKGMLAVLIRADGDDRSWRIPPVPGTNREGQQWVRYQPLVKQRATRALNRSTPRCPPWPSRPRARRRSPSRARPRRQCGPSIVSSRASDFRRRRARSSHWPCTS
jgi:hypothetical protein